MTYNLTHELRDFLHRRKYEHDRSNNPEELVIRMPPESKFELELEAYDFYGVPFGSRGEPFYFMGIRIEVFE